MAIDHVPGLDHVAAALRHLLALRVEDEAQADDVAVARGVEEQDRLGEQRVEPAAGLVDRLADEVGGEALLEELLVLERIVELGPGHRARVEPGVDHRDDAAHRPVAALALAAPAELVDVGAVEVLGDLARALPDVRDGAGAEALVAVGGIALPDRQRRAPVAVARERPVDVALEPLAEAAVLDVLGVPADLLVGRQQPVADLGGLHVPARLRVVEERGVAAPAVRIGVQVGLGTQQLPVGLQRLDDVLVGLLDEAAREVRDPLVEAAAVVDRVLQLDPVLLAEPEVVLTEGDRGVHEPGSLVGGDEVGEQNGVAAGAVVGDVVEGRLVGGAGEGLAGEMREHFGVLAEGVLDSIPGEHEDLIAEAGTDVLDLRARPRPRRW